MVSVEGLKVEFGVKPLFSGASFVVNERDRIALVGKNGAGKSTMLKILCGMQKPTAGSVAVPADTTIGYLPQVMILQDDTTVREEARKAFSGNMRLKERIDRMNAQLAERTDYESDSYMELVQKFTQEHERYMMMGAEGYEAEIERTLTGLGFARADLDRPTSEFSGGWRMRIELAKILLQKPDVLLLAALGTQLHIFVILHPVVDNLAAANLQRAVCHIVYEGPVVAHQNHGAGVLH